MVNIHPLAESFALHTIQKKFHDITVGAEHFYIGNFY